MTAEHSHAGGAAAARSNRPEGSLAGNSPFTGTATLLRFMLRQDRLFLAVWTVGIALFWLYPTRLVPIVYAPEELEGLGRAFGGPMGRLWTGPGYGFDQSRYDTFIAGGYGLYVLLLAALMSILLVVRHTRADEQAGRAELVRANVVGRFAPLTAALGVAVIANVLVAAAIAAVLVSSPHFGVRGTLLFAAGVAAAGLVFAAVTAVTAQLSESSRAAGGFAGAGLGAAFALRALGDMTSEHGGVLSWLSPLAWSQQTAPFVLDRWWPLALSLLFAAAAAAIGYALSARRDVGASVFAVTPGSARAPAWLASPLALAFRLQRASILAWAAAMAVAGLLFGAWTDAMLTSFDDLPDVIVELLGDRETIVDGYLSLMALFMALIAAIFPILAVQGLHGEETSGRGEPVLALPMSRFAWLGTYLAVTACGLSFILAAAGVATGVGAAAVTGDPTHVWDVTVAHLAYAPALLLVLALAALLFGVFPRLIGLTWLVPGYGLLAGVYGPLMDLPGWAADLSPFEHIARLPLEGLAPAPLIVLCLLAAAAGIVGLVAFRQRDFNVT